MTNITELIGLQFFSYSSPERAYKFTKSEQVNCVCKSRWTEMDHKK